MEKEKEIFGYGDMYVDDFLKKGMGGRIIAGLKERDVCGGFWGGFVFDFFLWFQKSGWIKVVIEVVMRRGFPFSPKKTFNKFSFFLFFLNSLGFP